MAWERLLITVSISERTEPEHCGTGDLSAGDTGCCIWRFTGICKIVEEVRYRAADPGMHCRVFYRLPVCADLKESDRFQFSGIRCGMLSGIYPVPVAIVFFQDHSTG